MAVHPSQLQPGSRVVMHFSLRFRDGTVAESSFDGEPLAFVVGDGSLVPNLELALYGLRAGDHQTLELRPEQAFGLRDTKNQHWLPREDFPKDISLERGVVIEFDTGLGETLPGVVLETEPERVKVDFNHPLAGHLLIFETRILSLEPPADFSWDED